MISDAANLYLINLLGNMQIQAGILGDVPAESTIKEQFVIEEFEIDEEFITMTTTDSETMKMKRIGMGAEFIVCEAPDGKSVYKFSIPILAKISEKIKSDSQGTSDSDSFLYSVDMIQKHSDSLSRLLASLDIGDKYEKYFPVSAIRFNGYTIGYTQKKLELDQIIDLDILLSQSAVEERLQYIKLLFDSLVDLHLSGVYINDPKLSNFFYDQSTDKVIVMDFSDGCSYSQVVKNSKSQIRCAEGFSSTKMFGMVEKYLPKDLLEIGLTQSNRLKRMMWRYKMSRQKGSIVELRNMIAEYIRYIETQNMTSENIEIEGAFKL